MIEIPECKTLAQQFTDTFGGKEVSFVEVDQTSHGFGWYNHDIEEYPALLVGKKLAQVRSLGGQLELVFEDMHLVFNDGITPRYLSSDDLPPAKHQFLMRFDDGSGFVCTVRMYGGMMIYPLGETDNEYYLVSRDKPSPLSDEFDRTYFEGIIQQTEPKTSIKALLATEQRIPGLGNGVLQDILYNAKINPKQKLSALDGDDINRLFNSVKTTLKTMTDQGGRDVEKDLFGKPGGYRTILSNKTKDDPCDNCGSTIEKKAYMGGNVYYCPVCQPM